MTGLRTARHWAGGIRLYIAIGIMLLTAQTWWWAGITYGDSPELMASRLHEIFGWQSLALLAVALGIGPVYKLAPNLAGKRIMRDARRMLGIGAAWFATLHAGVAYIISFQAVNPFNLSTTYKQAFLLGAVALLLLLALAFTSFNGAMKGLGIWWFRLHRAIYAVAGLAVWHAFIIGVHATSVLAMAIIVGTALVLLIGHIIVLMQQTEAPTVWQVATIGGFFLLLVILSNYGIQQYIDHNSLQGHQ